MKRPGFFTAIAEPFRSTGEFATSVGLLPFVPVLPKGDGHPVLVLPGFLATDGSTAWLRRLLGGLGYRTYGWGLKRNLGPTEDVVNGLPALVDSIAQDAGERISVIGWSLGGIYARHLGARTPDLIRSVVTMGTPVRRDVRELSNASPAFDALRTTHVPGYPLLDDGVPLPTPVTAMHTRSDGVVPWKACLVESAPNAENLRVRGSHIGLGHNPAVIYVVADRLAQPDGGWRPIHIPSPYRRIITTEDAAQLLS